MTIVVADKQRARIVDKNRLEMIRLMREKGMEEEANRLQEIHDKQQRIRQEYEAR